MKSAIIGGTGFSNIMGIGNQEIKIKTRFGEAVLYEGRNNASGLYFLPRHGKEHTIPPHRINYRANISALKILEVERILATFAVGSINHDIEPGAVVAIDQFLDFTSGRENSFFDGGASGVVHAEMNDPYCTNLRSSLITSAPRFISNFVDKGTYVCTNGPRFETPTEIRMYADLGGDVVGMTGVPEVVLAREVGIHYAALAHSINWAAGIEEKIKILEQGVNETREAIINLFIEVLQQTLSNSCDCLKALFVSHTPENDFYK